MIALMIIGVYSSTLIPFQERTADYLFLWQTLWWGYPGASPGNAENH